MIVLVHAAMGVSDSASLIAQMPTLVDAPVTRRRASPVAAEALISVLPMVAPLRTVARLFSLHRIGEVLSEANSVSILQIGRALEVVPARRKMR